MKPVTGQYDIVITGAGPAGLFCAIHAGNAGTRVLLLEKNRSAGEKLCISGTGQCNITHSGDMRDFFSKYGTHGKFLKPSLMNYTNRNVMEFFETRGIRMEITAGGKVFPKNRNAAEIRDILTKECRCRGVDIKYGDEVTRLERTADGFTLYTHDQVFTARTLVIATGGCSYQKTGSTGDGYRFAASLGHTIIEVGPALAPVVISNYPFADLAGLTFPGLHFSIWRDSRKIIDTCGDVLLTHTGLSGPGILDASRSIHEGDVIRLSFAGPVQQNTCAQTLLCQISANPKSLVKTLISGNGIPSRLAELLVRLAGIPEECTGAHLSAELRARLIELLTGCPLTVKKLGDFSVAMVTRGGISLDEVDPKTMESRIVPGLFFAGEVLDIDGDTGGYNLQAAFSTGYCAAQGCVRRLNAYGKIERI